jgi:hypothetical protein
MILLLLGYGNEIGHFSLLSELIVLFSLWTYTSIG